MVERQTLNVIDGDISCKGPSYTFRQEGIGQSYIDHVAITHSLLPYIVSVEVIDEEIDNTSDHLPIAITLHSSKLPKLVDIPKNKIAWHKLTDEDIMKLYTSPLEYNLQQRFPGECHYEIWYKDIKANDIDVIISDVVKCMKDASVNLPRKKFSKALKPYWCKDLTAASKEEKQLCKIWKEAGRPRGPNNVLYRQYKAAKTKFRRMRREKKYKWERKQMEDIANAENIDQNYMWYLVNKSRKKVGSSKHPIMVDDKVITDQEDIVAAWKDYYSALLSPSTDPDFDDAFKDMVEQRLIEMVEESKHRLNVLTEHPLTCKEIATLCHSLKAKKASGWDMIEPEHVKFGGTKLVSVLTGIYNAILNTEKVPDHFKLGIMVPIPKGGKNAVIMDNNRGLTLLPILEKVFEKATMRRFEPWAREKGLIHDLQGALQKGSSSLESTWLLREAIAHNLERNKSVFVALLDMKKAFDMIWTDGLFYKMFDTGMDGKLWRTLRDSYSGFKCCVCVNGTLSDSFNVGQSVHQGAPWSMVKFSLVFNDLINELCTSGDGVKIGGINVACPTFADDMSIVALYKTTLQQQLDRAYNYSVKWRMKYNAKKSEVLVFGVDDNPDEAVRIGNDVIPVVASSKHMGVVLTPTKGKEYEFVEDKISSGKRAYYAVQGIGSNSVPITPQVGSKLYWSLSVPRMTYGMEILHMSPKSMDALEVAHTSIAKQVQGLPKQTAKVCIATLGWQSLESYIDLKKLVFLWRILNLHATSIYRKVLLIRLLYHCMADGVHYGPTRYIMDVYDKYSLVHELQNGLITGEISSLGVFKNNAKRIIASYESKCYVATVLMYRSIPHILLCGPTIALWFWWCYASRYPSKKYKCRTMAKILYSETCLKADSARFGEVHNKVCTWCMGAVVEDAAHLLFECDRYNDLRCRKWNAVTGIMPDAMVQSIRNYNSSDKLKFILTGFNGAAYEPDWEDMYNAVLDFVYEMYRCHCKANL